MTWRELLADAVGVAAIGAIVFIGIWAVCIFDL